MWDCLVGKSKNKRRIAHSFIIFWLHLQSKLLVKRIAITRQKIYPKWLIIAKTRWALGQRAPLVPCSWTFFLADFFSSLRSQRKHLKNMSRNGSNWSLLLLENFPKCPHYCVGAFLKGSSVSIRSWPIGLQQPVGAFPIVSPHQHAFSVHFTQSTIFTLIFIRNQRRSGKVLKTIRLLFSYFPIIPH